MSMINDTFFLQYLKRLLGIFHIDKNDPLHARWMAKQVNPWQCLTTSIANRSLLSSELNVVCIGFLN